MYKLAVLAANPSTKFEDCSFKHPEHISWCANSKSGHVTLATTL